MAKASVELANSSKGIKGATIQTKSTVEEAVAVRSLETTSVR